MLCRHTYAKSLTGLHVHRNTRIHKAEPDSITWSGNGLIPPAGVLFRTLWLARFRLLIGSLTFALLGVIVALLQQPEYKSEARVMPEMKNGASDLFKRLSSVAGFASIDFDDAEGMEAIRPDLYPNVLQSTPFVLYLIEKPIIISSGETKTVTQLLLPNTGFRVFKNRLFSSETESTGAPVPKKTAGTVRLTARQQELAEELDTRVSARLDTRSGLITITAQMPDAQAAAAVAQLAMNYLTGYVTNYRTEKARQDLDFYANQLAEAQKRYQKAQLTIFQHNDNNRNLVLQTATMNRQRMLAELTIAQTVYTDLSGQFERAKLKVQEQTPVFKVLEPPKIPLKRTSPKRTLIVLGFAFAGLVLSALWTVIKKANVSGQLRAILIQG